MNSRADNATRDQTHVATQNRATANHYLLQLQRQYGNRHVQRVLALSRQVDGEAEVAPEVEQIIHRSRGSGQALDSGVRTHMESAFGADFSGVRVHTDANADTLSRALNARAFTTDQDIFFRQGEYNPDSSVGRELLAHELTHVVQQSDADPQRKLTIGHSGDKYEQEADRVARAIIEIDYQSSGRNVSEHIVKRQVDEEEDEEEIPFQTKVENTQIERRHGKGEIQRERVAAFGESEFEPLEFPPPSYNIFPPIEAFLSDVRGYLQNLRDANQEANLVFANTMFHETQETAQADVMSAVLKKGLELGKDALVDAIGERIPGFSQLVDLVEAAIEEVERADRASREATLVQFINRHVLETGTIIQRLQEYLRTEVAREQLAIDAFGSEDLPAFASMLQEQGDRLSAPEPREILGVLTEAYVQEQFSIQYGGLFGASEYATGILYLEYEVNDEATRATLEEVKLVSPYAAQVKALLRETIGDRINTSTLRMHRIIHLERSRFYEDDHILNPNDREPRGRGGFGYFARLVRTMPTVSINDIETTDEPIFI